MLSADVYFTKSDHLVRIMTGLHLLETQGILRCRYNEDVHHQVLPESASILEIRIDGKRIAFDLRDASALNQAKNQEYLSQVDTYFERSHQDWSKHSVLAGQSHKIHPFGFDYFASYLGNPAVLSSIGKNPIQKALRNIINNSRYTHIETFEGKANTTATQSPQILFMTRLWDPDDIKIRPDMTPEQIAYRRKMAEERRKINQDRIELCRRLKTIYGSAFCGGVQRSRFAKSVCPDLILPAHLSLRPNYIKRMKQADICIGSAGLEKSIGWKTGEYVAAARAIICEEFAYLLPGNFEKGINYLPYHDVDSCLAAVEQLYKNPEQIYRMQQANETYYWEYLRPEQQILNALRISGVNI